MYSKERLWNMLGTHASGSHYTSLQRIHFDDTRTPESSTQRSQLMNATAYPTKVFTSICCITTVLLKTDKRRKVVLTGIRSRVSIKRIIGAESEIKLKLVGWGMFLSRPKAISPPFCIHPETKVTVSTPPTNIHMSHQGTFLLLDINVPSV